MAGATGNLIGIDLGTTFCAVATLDDHGQPVTLPNRDGEMLTPSAVLLPADGEAVVGQSALDVALEQPERVATLIKRRMGYPSYGRPVAGSEFRPETLSAVILRKLVQDAEARIGPVRQAVITVPAYFDDTRRKADQDAGNVAGLEVLDILDEPTAAALAYSFQTAAPHPASSPPTRGGQGGEADPSRSRTVLVYDLGGGTFDVTLVRLSPKAVPDAGHRGRRSSRRQGLGRPHRGSRRRPVYASRWGPTRVPIRSRSRLCKPPPSAPSAPSASSRKRPSPAPTAARC